MNTHYSSPRVADVTQLHCSVSGKPFLGCPDILQISSSVSECPGSSTFLSVPHLFSHLSTVLCLPSLPNIQSANNENPSQKREREERYTRYPGKKDVVVHLAAGERMAITSSTRKNQKIFLAYYLSILEGSVHGHQA